MDRKAAPIDLVLLQTFCEVARLGSVSEAARVLHRSQPAISRRLKALERDLGLALFEKVGRRLRLTEQGRKLFGKCADLLAISRSIREELEEREEIAGTVTVGTFNKIATALWRPHLSALLRRFPRLRITLEIAGLDALCRSLRSGRSDVLLVIGEVAEGSFEMERVGEDRLVAVMTPDLAPRGRGRIPPEALRRLRYIDWHYPGDTTSERIHAYAVRHRLIQANTPLVPHIETTHALVEDGVGYAILPEFLLRNRESGLVVLHPEGLDDGIDLWLIGRKGQFIGPALRIVRDSLRCAAQGMGGPPAQT